MTQKENMRIAILGTGHIGKTFSRKLSTAGYRVNVANSRGSETIAADVLDTGAELVAAFERNCYSSDIHPRDN